LETFNPTVPTDRTDRTDRTVQRDVLPTC